MRIERTKNASRNFAYGIFYRFYSIVFPFVIRTAIIYLLGVEYLGLNSLFSSILQVLNLAELGVGSAMVFSMYAPIARNDSSKICSLMKLYRIYYRIIGLVILLGGVILSPIIPMLIEQDVPPSINIYILYYLNLLATILTYWLFAYRNCLFQAFQRIDIITKTTLISDTVKYCGQLVALAVFHDLYIFFIVGILGQVFNNILILLFSKKYYPDLNPTGSIQKEERKTINGRIRDLFTSKLGWTIVSSADTIVISAFLGLKVLAVYQNYYYIVSALQGMIIILFNSVVAGSGNSMIVDSNEKNYHDLKKLSFITFWLLGYCCAGILCIMQIFMKVWVGDELLLPFYFVILFCIYLTGNIIVQLLSVYKDAAGIWHKDRFRPLASGITNLGLNLIFVNYFNLMGVVLSTIISVFFVSVPWIIKNVFILIFPGRFRDYFRLMINMLCAISISAIFPYLICYAIEGDGIGKLVLNLVICTTGYNLAMYIIYRRSEILSELFSTMKILARNRSSK
ncbi:lipopolysaccharide biosynthesis protein [Sporofaciens musculi]|uniref:lipopolysaccharide biosynthesis protein n=1 Tax=Sporofaciens musculi TaxID=2681861 RepID=UPI00258753AD|nr:oligosaccharide flippase family protein [Sporofaciens musculi]